jgi:hypothetical protein
MPDLLNLPSTAAMMVTVEEMKDVYFIDLQRPILTSMESVPDFCTPSFGYLVLDITTAMVIH